MGGGIARLHGELARRFLPGELIVSTPQDPDAADSDSQFPCVVDRLSIGRRSAKTLPGLLRWSRRAAKLARERAVRFVYCGNVKPAGYPTRWVYERTRIPYALFLYGADLLSEQHKYHHSALKRRSGRAILGGAAALIAISSWTRDLALTVLGELGLDGHGQRLRVLHLGTDPDRFQPAIDSTALRERFQLPGGVRWLLTVARLEPHKGMDTVIAALPAIAARASDVGYLIAGSGPAREKLERLAQKAGVADRVRFLGEVGEQDLPALYNAASAYVGVSRRAERIGVEGFGISLVEASACALPIVAGDSGGVPDAVRAGETGFLVPPEDVAAVADAVCRLLTDRELAGRIGAAGRRAVETYYNWDRVVRDLRTIEAEAS
jgi:phosphatidyl-myo-inositol dimannoside synthase